MTAAVVVAVGEPRNTVSVVPSLKVDDQPAATLAAVLPQVLLKPPDRDRSQWFQGEAAPHLRRPRGARLSTIELSVYFPR